MKITIYSNYDLDKYREDALEYLRDQFDGEDEDWEEPSENEIWDEIYQMDEVEWDERSYELKKYFNRNGNHGFLLQGYVGTWRGPARGGFVFDTWEDLMKHEPTADCGYIHWYDEGGHLHLECSHHDGTNHYEIKMLTKKGRELIDNWRYDWNDNRTESQIHDIIMKSNLFSVLPKFAKQVYGC